MAVLWGRVSPVMACSSIMNISAQSGAISSSMSHMSLYWQLQAPSEDSMASIFSTATTHNNTLKHCFHQHVSACVCTHSDVNLIVDWTQRRSNVSTVHLTLFLHSEPLLKDRVLQEEVKKTGQDWRIWQVAAQLLLKLQHLLHQVTEKSVVVQNPQGIAGNLLLNQRQQPSAELHLHKHAEKAFIFHINSTAAN